ncbi:hypothetical protein WMY93_003404 [Mugilogobius chulae]|uniref:DDE Tnp4 domain-containing protein n=1 Tax=Mugilogobius chulae TaxID=88201 RepID=A0AAW0PY76_9GOBI
MGYNTATTSDERYNRLKARKDKVATEESALTQLCLAESDETEPTDSELLHPICKFHLLGSLEGNDMCSKEKAASDIAHRFNIAPSTVSKCFIAVLDVMYWRMKRIIQWPEREQLHLTMPMEFRHAFGLKCAVLIDCFEIFIERPSCLEERAGTWSSYKHHNTIKILIGITPQGSISFLSECWGGRVSDKHITEHCGLLDKLIPGDMILADRGFDIQDVVGACGAEAKIPAFTKGKSQLSPLELEATRKIAHLRIHVERVIGLLRNKYTILQATLPMDYLTCEEGEVPTVEKMLTVCAALVNLNNSVIPFD